MERLRAACGRVIVGILVFFLSSAITSCNGPVGDLADSTGINQAGELFNARSQVLARDLYGKLPNLPEGVEVLDNDAFVPFGDLSGKLRTAFVVRPTWFSSNGYRCPLSGGTKIFAVAKVSTASGDYMLAHLKEPCKAQKFGPGANDSNFSGDGDSDGKSSQQLSEAYVEMKDARVSEDRDVDAGDADDDDVEIDDDDDSPGANGVCQKATIGIAYGEDEAGQPAINIKAGSGVGGENKGYHYNYQSIQGNLFRQGGTQGQNAAYFAFKVPGKNPVVEVTLSKKNKTVKTYSNGYNYCPNSNGNNNSSKDSQDEQAPADCFTGDTMKLGSIQLKNHSKKDGFYLVPLEGLVKKNNWMGIPILVEVKDGKGKSEECGFEFSLASPIVLDLANKGKPDLLHPYESKVKFDIDADGKKDAIGWLKPHSGLLVVDFNENGTIDNGTELFGEYTNGKRFQNGYQAMAKFDADKSGFLDKADPVFSRLMVWQDKNLDGESQPTELLPISVHRITKIATGYSTADYGTMVFDNHVPYESRFYGPDNCGKTGCKSFDVFFGVRESIELADVIDDKL